MQVDYYESLMVYGFVDRIWQDQENRSTGFVEFCLSKWESDQGMITESEAELIRYECSRRVTLETAEQIKAAVREGRKVYCDTNAYVVENPAGEQWLICFAHSDYCIGLTWKDGHTLNGKIFWYET